MAEITTTGYSLKSQNDWFAEEKELYLAIDSAWALDESTPDGLKMASDAEIFYALDEVLQQAYNSKDPAKATGNDLDVIGTLTGASRVSGTYSTATVTLTGTTIAVTVPAGTRIQSSYDSTYWALDSAYTIPANGTVDASVTCTTIGAIEADAGTLTIIADPVGGFSSVTNATAATTGTAAQSDADFRISRATSVGKPGNNQVDSYYGSIWSVSGIRRVRIYENDTGVVDSNGQPANSVAILVDGGAVQDIADAIFVKKNPGVLLYQAGTAVSATSASSSYPNNTKTINFSRPVYVQIIVAMTIKNDGTLPSNIAALIQAAIISYAAGDLIADGVGYNADGFDIGVSVPISAIYTPINYVLGQYGSSYVQSLTLNGASSNVAIAWNQLSNWTTDNITVTLA